MEFSLVKVMDVDTMSADEDKSSQEGSRIASSGPTLESKGCTCPQCGLFFEESQVAFHVLEI